MLIYFVIGQTIVALATRSYFGLRHRHWSPRHTWLCTAVPSGVFLLWEAFWCWAPLTDLSPAPLLQELWPPQFGRPVSAIIWECGLPILFSGLLFKYIISNQRRDA